MNQPGPTGQVRRNREIKLDGILVITHATRIRHVNYAENTLLDPLSLVDEPEPYSPAA